MVSVFVAVVIYLMILVVVGALYITRIRRNFVVWAPKGKIYVCPQCLRVSQLRGYCMSDGEACVLRPERRCPQGHSIAVLKYNLLPPFCPVCGADTCEETP